MRRREQLLNGVKVEVVRNNLVKLGDLIGGEKDKI